MQEHDAIALLKRGDIAGLDALVRLHQYQAVRAAALIVRDRAMAEDIVQSAFLRVVGRIHQFDSQRPFGPWFLRIVTNDALKEGQRRERFASLDQPGETEQSPLDLLPDQASGPELLLEQGETREAVVGALNRLTPLQRTAIVQRYYLGMSEAEMARDGASTVGAIKLRLFAARERLHRLLRPLLRESASTE